MSFKETKEIFGEEKATQIFESVGLSTKPGRKSKPKRELTEKEYIKLKEDDHGKLFKNFLDDYSDIKFTHIGNESGQGGTKNIIIMMAKKKSLGVSPGFPDYIISIYGHTLYIELKKAKGPKGGWNGSTISEEQVEWLNHLQNNICSYCEIAHGSNEAIKIFLKYYNDLKNLNINESLEYWNKKEKRDFRELLTTTQN